MSDVLLRIVSRVVRISVNCKVTWWIGHSIAQLCRLLARLPFVRIIALPVGRLYHWAMSLKDRDALINMRKGGGQILGLEALVDWWGKIENLVMVEVGSYRGESAALFLKSGKIAKLYCVDPWLPFYDLDDPAAYSDMKAVELSFDQRFSADDRVVKVKGTVDDLLRLYPDLSPDLYYVDGCHTYDGVKHDLDSILEFKPPKLFLCGHDFVDGWAGCKRAVLEVVGEPDATFADGSWVKRMP